MSGYEILAVMYFNMPSHIEFGTLVKSADYSEIAFYRTYPTFF